MPKHERVDEDVDIGLRGNGPISIALPCHQDTRQIGNDDGCHACLGLLLGAKVLEQPSRLCKTEAADEESEEGIAA